MVNLHDAIYSAIDSETGILLYGTYNEYGQIHGFGSMKCPEGITYVGHFKNGNRHGHGQSKLINGDIFTGIYKDNARNGYGEYTWVRTGSTYKGNFSNNL